MTQWLRQATASQEILLGPFLDSTDGNTQETALTIAASDIKLWKEGLTSESNKNLGGATHIANGRYSAVLDNTDTATAGKLEINVHVAGALAVRREYMVLPANVYDALVYGTDLLDVSATQLAGQTITAGAGVTFPSSVASPTNITAGTITTVTTLTNLPAITAGWITAAGIAASALNGKGDWNVGKTGYSLTQGFPSNFSALSITAGGLVDITQAAADKAWGTASRVLTAGTNIALAKGTGITGFNDLDAAGVAAATWNAATATYGSAGSYGLLIETNLDAQVSTVGGGSLTEAGIADAVWDEVLSGHLTASTTGNALNAAGAAGDPWTTTLPGAYGAGTAGKIIGDNINATISSRASQTSVDTVDTVVDAILVDTAVIGATGGGLTSLATQASVNTIDDLLDTEVAAIKADTAAIKLKTDNLPSDPADASDIAASFTTLTGKVDVIDDFLDTEIAAIKAQTDSMPTAAAIADAVWDESLAGHAIVGSTGEALDGAGGGGGGVADWTSDEKTVIRAVLGIPGSGTTPADPTTGILDTIRDAVGVVDDLLDTEMPALTTAVASVSSKVDTVDDLLDTEMPALTAAVAAVKAETASIQVDTNDIQARLPAALVGGRMDSNLSAISNSTTTMAAFNRAVKGNVIGTVGVGSTTTSIVSSSVTPAGSVADKFKGRLLTFADDTTTANLRGQSTDITACTSAAAPTFTVTALTTAAVSGDTFSIT